MKRLLLTVAGVGLTTSLVFAQSQSVRGVITDATTGEPIIGANVVVKGHTNVGAATDLNGQFVLNAPKGATTLVVTYMGYKTQEVLIKSNLKITLKAETTALKDVVVTAMGISRDRKALGYSVQDIKSDALTQAANTSLSGALQGKVSGIDITPSSGMPGASARITIRGSRSFTGSNEPLYVVDGMPIASSSDMDTRSSVTGADNANRAVDLDPNDIESINILKGQAASALYGMRASNGVVVITTKSGKGARKGRPEVTINSGISFDEVSILPKFQTEYAQGSLVKGKYTFNPNSSLSWGPKISELANDPTYGGNVANKYTAGGLQKGKYYVPQRASAGLDPWATPQAYSNAKDFFKTGVSVNTNVNIAQALDNNKGHYSFSLGHTNTTGIVPSTGLARYNAKLGAQLKLNRYWSTGFNGNFVHSFLTKQTGANDGVVATVYGAPASYDLAGIPSHIATDPYTQVNYRPTSGFNNAYWATNNNEFSEKAIRFFGNAFLQYDTDFNTNGEHKLIAKYQLGVDSYNTLYRNVFGYGSKNKFGSIDEDNYMSTELNSLLTFNYNWKISEDLNLGTLLGNEIVESSDDLSSTTGTGFNYAGFNHLSNASKYVATERMRRYRTFGTFANVSLDYKNMLFFNATLRNDRVSSMPRNSRSFTYPSVSLGFIFTELKALKNKVLTFGKLRASYAEVGQAGSYLPSYYLTPVYGAGFHTSTPISYPLGGVNAFAPYELLYDPDLKPQNTKSYEVGADLTFFGGLFSINYTYSRQNVVDQIFDVPLASSTGYSELRTNGGRVHTDAHELTLNINPIRTDNINWELGVNFSKIDNYVDELADGVESITLGGFVTPQVRLSVGEKFPVIYGDSFLRNKEGQIVVDADGLPQVGESKVIGRVSPDFRMGFSTSLDIHKLKLSAVFDWKKGGQMYGGTAGVLNLYGVTQKSADMRNKENFLFELPAVKQNNDGSYSPNDILISGSDAFYYFNTLTNISEASIVDASFLKLREVSLSYPVYAKPKLHVTARVFARNLLLWSGNDTGIDPESSQGNNNMSGAFERFSLPGTSSYGFGLSVKF